MPVLLRSEVEASALSLQHLEQSAENLLRLSGHEKSELSILVVDDLKMAEFNNQFRGKDKATNVLSFPLFDDDTIQGNSNESEIPHMLGDIVISIDTAGKEAEARKQSLDDYFVILLVHGFIHLLGFDHERSDEEALEMAAQEKKLLKIILDNQTVAPLSEEGESSW